MKYPLLTDDDIRRFLCQVRYNAVFRHRDTRVPLWSLLQLIGISRQTGYSILLKRYHHALYPATREKLSLGANLVARGLRFTRRDRRWEPVMPTSLEIRWPAIYSGGPLEEKNRGHQNVGVSQQALPKSVRLGKRSSALSALQGGAGEMDAEAVRHLEKRAKSRRICPNLSRRFPNVQFSNPKHWRKQRYAAKLTRRLNKIRALASARNAGMGRKTAD